MMKTIMAGPKRLIIKWIVNRKKEEEKRVNSVHELRNKRERWGVFYSFINEVIMYYICFRQEIIREKIIKIQKV